jgi:hypothetical protein
MFSKLTDTEPEDHDLYDLALDVSHEVSDSEIANTVVRESIKIKYGDEAHPAVAF